MSIGQFKYYSKMAFNCIYLGANIKCPAVINNSITRMPSYDSAVQYAYQFLENVCANDITDSDIVSQPVFILITQYINTIVIDSITMPTIKKPLYNAFMISVPSESKHLVLIHDCQLFMV